MYLFEFSFVFGKPLCQAFAKLHLARRKMRLLFSILSFVLFAAALVAAYLGRGSGSFLGLVSLGLFWLFYYLWMEWFVGRSCYKNASKATEDASLIYRFSEDFFSQQSSLQNVTLAYSAVTDLMESEQVLLLYTGRNRAYILDKQAISPALLEPFRQLLQQKTGLTIRSVRVAHRKRGNILLCVGGVLAALVVAVAGYSFGFLPCTYYGDGFTVTIPRQFQQTYDSYYAFEAYAGMDTCVWAMYYSQEELEEYYGPFDSASQALYLLTENMEGVSDMQYGLLSDGTPYAAFTIEWDGLSYYYLDTLRLTQEGYLMTECYCPATEANLYLEDFATWSESVMITQASMVDQNGANPL